MEDDDEIRMTDMPIEMGEMTCSSNRRWNINRNYKKAGGSAVLSMVQISEK